MSEAIINTTIKQRSLDNRLLLFSLSLVVLCFVGCWRLTTVRFIPSDGSIPLTQAILIADDIADDGLCQESIPDSLATAEVMNSSLPDLLTKCVRALLAERKARGQAVMLPHEWRYGVSSMPNLNSGRAVYHMQFPFTTAPNSPWAIALPATGQNLAVWVNGVLLGWGGSFEQPVARNMSRPRLYTIPEGILQAGDNQFDVYVVSQPAVKGFLDRVQIGPVELLEPAIQRYNFFRSIMPQMISLVVFVLSLAMALLWLYRRQDTEYGLFALGGVFWAVHTLDQFVVKTPINTALWDWLMLVSAGGLSLSGIFFIHRFLREPHLALEKRLLIGFGGLATLLLLLPEAWFYPASIYLWNPLVWLGVVYSLQFILRRTQRIPPNELYALVASSSVIVGLGLYDLLVLMGHRALPYGFFLHFGALLLLLSFGWILLQRFVRSLQDVEAANKQLVLINQDLEARVDEKTKKIAQSYETIRLLGQEQVLLHERSRIMRDMHDGIGVYLTSMLRQLDKDPVDKDHLREAARNALNDLRLMIDSLGSASSDLPAMLGMFRTRISMALEACNVELDWQVDELPALPDFGPERALNLLRILQEAFTNALKHSGASIIKLVARMDVIDSGEQFVLVEVIDNGKGFTSTQSAGHGLKNMRFRAQKIRADITMDSSGDGTQIAIRLPVSQH